MHTYVHAYILTYILAYTHAYVHACMYYTHAYTHACIHTCMHTHMHACMHARKHTHTHTYMHAYIHTCTRRARGDNVYSNLRKRMVGAFPFPFSQSFVKFEVYLLNEWVHVIVVLQTFSHAHFLEDVNRNVAPVTLFVSFDM